MQFWSEMNTATSFVIWFWIVVPAIYFTNTFYTGYFPMSAYFSWDNTASRYQANAVVTDSLFDAEKYAAYSPVFMSATLVMAYAVSFASFASVFVHTFCKS